jgi:hypothetical protein
MSVRTMPYSDDYVSDCLSFLATILREPSIRLLPEFARFMPGSISAAAEPGGHIGDNQIRER